MVKFSTLFSGSSGNCLFVSDGETRLLVDVGKSARAVERELKKIGEEAGQLSGILLTHEHIDHIRGLCTLAKKWNLTIFANKSTVAGASLHEAVGHKVFVFEESKNFCIGQMEVTPICLSHDAADTTGFAIHFLREDKRITIATDTGRITEDLARVIPGNDLVYIESNYDENMLFSGRYPYFLKRRIAGDTGHLSNLECARLCAQAVAGGARHLVLGHLSHENNLPELAYMTCQDSLQQQGMIVDKDCTLDVSPRESAGRIIIF
jgi:phosphoribosyl 1,2-cyclic phosphodiesterase